MPNTKTGTTWAPDIRPGAIETFTETYTPDGGTEQTLTYKRVADHPILNGIRDIKAFFTTHVGAVWYNLQEQQTLLAKLDEMDAEIKVLKNTNNQLDTVDPMTATEEGLAADAKLTGTVLNNLNTKMSSFEQAKSTIVNSALGKALGMAASTALATAAAKIASIVNRGAWTSRITTYNGKVTVPAGYHNGSGYVQASITNRGAWSSTITTAGGSITIPAGYHNGSGKVSVSGLYVPPKKQNGSFTSTKMYAGSSSTQTITFPTSFSAVPSVIASATKTNYSGSYNNAVAEIQATVTVKNVTKTGFQAVITAPRSNSGDTNSYVATVAWNAGV